MNTTWSITGMTCDHCANAIREEVSELGGVTAVTIDRPAGTMTIASDIELDPALVTEAVAEAGNYQATPTP